MMSNVAEKRIEKNDASEKRIMFPSREKWSLSRFHPSVNKFFSCHFSLQILCPFRRVHFLPRVTVM